MTATNEHKAHLRFQRRTHAALARSLGRDDLLATFEPPADEQERDRAAYDVRTAIEDAARILSPAEAARLASEAIADVLRGR